MKNIFLMMLLWLTIESNAQFSNNVWCFGDSAGIRFTNGIATNFNSSVKSRGSCVSIADSNDFLLFYAFTNSPFQYYTGRVFDNSHNLMLNGDSIASRDWYQEMVIVPKPSDTNKFYLFSTLVTSFKGLYYSEIDMSLNNGLGAVTQKNIQLDTLQGIDCLTAIKHGNGRDWWLMYCPNFIPDSSDLFYLYLVDSNGINPPFVKHVGQKTLTNEASIAFNVKGNQFARSTLYGLLELFDFDRCTGDITSHAIIENQPIVNAYFSLAFSPSGRYLYTCKPATKVFLYQFDLQAANIKASRLTLDTSSYPAYSGGWLKLAPDSNIYWTNRFYDGCGGTTFCDTTYNMYNMNLSVINEPDSPGLACNFTKYSFYLGGNRTLWGLPNNPDYDLPGDSGCSNVSSPPAPQRGDQKLHATYIAAWEKLFVNAQNLKGKNVTITIYDAAGKEKFARGKPPGGGLGVYSGYFTLDVDCTGWSGGLYVVHLETEAERLSRKFVRE